MGCMLRLIKHLQRNNCRREFVILGLSVHLLPQDIPRKISLTLCDNETLMLSHVNDLNEYAFGREETIVEENGCFKLIFSLPMEDEVWEVSMDCKSKIFVR